MKILFVLCMVLGVLFTTSCDNDAEEIQAEAKTVAGDTVIVDEAEELRNLQAQIAQLKENYGRKIMSSSSTLPLTNISCISNVYKADLSGAAFGMKWGPLGALACGAVSSICSYYFNKKNIRMTNMNSLKMNNILGKATVQMGCGNSLIDSLGYYHNRVILMVGVNNLSKLSYSELKSRAIDAVYKLKKEAPQYISRDMLYTDKGMLFLEGHMPRLNSAADAKSYCNILRRGFTAISNEEMDFVTEYMDGLDTKISARGEYVKKAINIVAGSKLTTDTKERLLSGFVVGNASVILWGNVVTAAQ